MRNTAIPVTKIDATEQSGDQALRHPAREARAEAERGSGWYAWLARTGLVAKGISFGIVGVLAIKLALGSGGKATSREGALKTLTHTSFGKVLLIVLALGFAAYAIWRFVKRSSSAKTTVERPRSGESAPGISAAG